MDQISRDENAPVIPVAEKTMDSLEVAATTARSPLRDVSNQGDSSLNGSNKGLKPSSLADPQENGRSVTPVSISPACSTPRSSRELDTTDDYESADEGPKSPSHPLSLSVLADELEKLNLGTPSVPSAEPRPKVAFPYSPCEAVFVSSPNKEENSSDESWEQLSPVTEVVTPRHSVVSPEVVENSSTAEDDQLTPTNLQGRRSTETSKTVTLLSSPPISEDKEFFDKSTDQSNISDISSINSSRKLVNVTDKSQIACDSFEGTPPINNSVFDRRLTESLTKEFTAETSKDSIANVSTITVRDSSPLASKFLNKSHEEALNSSFAPATFDPLHTELPSIGTVVGKSSQEGQTSSEELRSASSPSDKSQVKSGNELSTSSNNLDSSRKNLSEKVVNDLLTASEVVNSAISEAEHFVKDSLVVPDKGKRNGNESVSEILTIAEGRPIDACLPKEVNLSETCDPKTGGPAVPESNSHKNEVKEELTSSNEDKNLAEEKHLEADLKSLKETGSKDTEIHSKACPKESVPPVRSSLGNAKDESLTTDESTVSGDESTVIENESYEECTEASKGLETLSIVNNPSLGTELKDVSPVESVKSTESVALLIKSSPVPVVSEKTSAEERVQEALAVNSSLEIDIPVSESNCDGTEESHIVVEGASLATEEAVVGQVDSSSKAAGSYKVEVSEGKVTVDSSLGVDVSVSKSYNSEETIKSHIVAERTSPATEKAVLEQVASSSIAPLNGKASEVSEEKVDIKSSVGVDIAVSESSNPEETKESHIVVEETSPATKEGIVEHIDSSSIAPSESPSTEANEKEPEQLEKASSEEANAVVDESVCSTLNDAVHSVAIDQTPSSDLVREIEHHLESEKSIGDGLKDNSSCAIGEVLDNETTPIHSEPVTPAPVVSQTASQVEENIISEDSLKSHNVALAETQSEDRSSSSVCESPCIKESTVEQDTSVFKEELVQQVIQEKPNQVEEKAAEGSDSNISRCANSRSADIDELSGLLTRVDISEDTSKSVLKQDENQKVDPDSGETKESSISITDHNQAESETRESRIESPHVTVPGKARDSTETATPSVAVSWAAIDPIKELGTPSNLIKSEPLRSPDILQNFDISPKRPNPISSHRFSLPANNSSQVTPKRSTMNTSFTLSSGSELPDIMKTPQPEDMVHTLDRSYKDLSEILATCSKQEQELGGETFDFQSCIQAEAAKIADEISRGDDSKATSCNQHMMQSSLSAEINNSEAGPITADEDFNKQETFQDASTIDFEYLSQVGGRGHFASKYARQSLYVKFDPLVEKLLASTEDPDCSLVSAMAENQSSGEESKLDVTPTTHSENNDERLIPITPATAKKTNENRVSSGGHTPSLRQEISKLQELMIQQEQAHQEKADLVDELRQRIAELEASDSPDTNTLEKQLKSRDVELARTKKDLAEQITSNRQLVQVMEEYEKTISQLVTIKEETKAQYEKEKETIASERDTALQHLSNMEVAFNDIHQKYERAKGVIETLHGNEKELKKSYDALMETVEHQKQAYQKFKQHATEKLVAANGELEKVHKEYQGEMARMKAVAKKSDLRCKSLEESLEQKNKELREMTQICDELIGKVTGKPYE